MIRIFALSSFALSSFALSSFALSIGRVSISLFAGLSLAQAQSSDSTSSATLNPNPTLSPLATSTNSTSSARIDHNCLHNVVLWVDPATNLDYPQRTLEEAAEQIFCADNAPERQALRDLRARIKKRKPIASVSNTSEARLMVVPVRAQKSSSSRNQGRLIDTAEALHFGHRGEVFYRRHIYRIDRKLVEQAYLPLRDEGDLRQSQANELSESSRRPATADPGR